jgi:PhoPQ-activated pathogenicity-related protein
VMLHHWTRLCVVLLTLAVAPLAFAKRPNPTASPATALADYVAAPDDSYGYKLRRSGKYAQGSYVELTLTSQTWQGQPWRHQLFIYKPSQVAPNASGLLLISGGSWRDELAAPAAKDDHQLPNEALVLTQIAEALHAPVAIVCQVPEQPLFDGMHEDEIISYTFEEFCKTGDCDWPLLLPMVKSAVRAMDATTEFTAKEWDIDLDKFVVTGASKRGWTTWLTAAVDPRVSALAPLVINMLNMEPHMQLQKKSFGGFSDEISDYTDRGIDKLMGTKRGAELRAIVDPFSYRAEITQPKLIILGTNDRYWPVDSLNLYWDELTGAKHVLYVPNNGHGISDYPRVIGAVAALYKSTSSGKPLPPSEWHVDKSDDKVVLHLSVDDEPLQVAAWTAAAESRDFRTAKWTSKPASANGSKKSYKIELPRPADGFAALFAEVKFPGEPFPFHLSSGLEVVEPAAPASP